MLSTIQFWVSLTAVYFMQFRIQFFRADILALYIVDYEYKYNGFKCNMA
jgi:hypothetical protein